MENIQNNTLNVDMEQKDISKEQFVKYWQELAKLFNSTEVDEIYKMLEGASAMLFEKAGFNRSTFDMYVNSTFLEDCSFFNEDADKISNLYDMLKQENKVVLSSKELLSQIKSL